MEKIYKILEQLLERTKAKKANWKKVDNGFLISLDGKSYLTISSYEKNQWEYVYILTIYNDQGYRIVNQDTDGDEQLFNILDHLYEAINNLYYKVDETLDSIIGKLEGSSEAVGDPNFKIKKVDDDLPF
ncbi:MULTISPECIES: hypothetical protein [Sphingobacterium]|uniref:Uncharacterized protein n=1 Tax=Sphingobacterium populi TaxID=1812824 RepID=A0ABW5U7P4_9SPHI|nr:hypothetical protein [Sphingobacterium sp. CFCC 11742]